MYLILQKVMILAIRIHQNSTELQDWHSEKCKLMLTLTLDFLTSNKMGEEYLSCTYYPPAKFGDDISIGFLSYSADTQTDRHTHTYVHGG